jgi:hypothetical protein
MDRKAFKWQVELPRTLNNSKLNRDAELMKLGKVLPVFSADFWQLDDYEEKEKFLEAVGKCGGIRAFRVQRNEAGMFGDGDPITEETFEFVLDALSSSKLICESILEVKVENLDWHDAALIQKFCSFSQRSINLEEFHWSDFRYREGNSAEIERDTLLVLKMLKLNPKSYFSLGLKIHFSERCILELSSLLRSKSITSLSLSRVGGMGNLEPILLAISNSSLTSLQISSGDGKVFPLLSSNMHCLQGLRKFHLYECVVRPRDLSKFVDGVLQIENLDDLQLNFYPGLKSDLSEILLQRLSHYSNLNHLWLRNVVISAPFGFSDSLSDLSLELERGAIGNPRRLVFDISFSEYFKSSKSLRKLELNFCSNSLAKAISESLVLECLHLESFSVVNNQVDAEHSSEVVSFISSALSMNCTLTELSIGTPLKAEDISALVHALETNSNLLSLDVNVRDEVSGFKTNLDQKASEGVSEVLQDIFRANQSLTSLSLGSFEDHRIVTLLDNIPHNLIQFGEKNFHCESLEANRLKFQLQARLVLIHIIAVNDRFEKETLRSIFEMSAN